MKGIEKILDHYKNPRNFGRLSNPDIVHKEGEPSCGDEVRLELKIASERIEDVKFTGKGCSVCIASASLLTENIKGKRIDEIKEMKPDDLFTLLGVELTETRKGCALLPLKALKIGLFGRWEFDESL